MRLIPIIFLLISSVSYGAGWIQKADFGGEARHRTTMLTIGNKIYTGLGHYNGAGPNILFDDWWEYDPATNAWTQKADYAGGICYHAAGFVINNIGYVGTGRTSPSGSTLVKDFFKYNPATNTWTQLQDFPGAGRRGAVGFAINGFGYIGTGSGYSDFYRFNPTTETWSPIPSIPNGGRISAVGFELDGFGYVGTGYNYNVGYSTTDFYKYNPNTNSWSQISNAGTTNRMESTGFGLNGKGYLLTGDNYSSGTNYKDMWEYTPATNTWVQIEDFEGTARRYMSTTVLNDVAYAGLGTNGTNFKDFWLYDATLSLIEQKLEVNHINTFPNPVSDYVNIQIDGLDENELNKLDIKIISTSGTLVYNNTISASKTVIDIKNWNNGLYLYSIEYQEKVLHSGKILKQ